MGRRKKTDIIENTFVPSAYQTRIFDFIQNGEGNLVIEALAGSGKSTTLLKMLDLISVDKKVLFCAFNLEIVKDLKKRVGIRPNVTVSTVHSLGYKIIKDNIGEEVETLPNKYTEHIWKNIKEYSSMNLYALGKKNYTRYIDNVVKLVDHCRYNLADTIPSILPIVERHGIPLLGDEIEVALKILEWGKSHVDCIDFTDMLWIPHVLDLPHEKFTYDYVLFDECQDASIAQRELILKCQNENTRFVFVGDRNQSIYSFMSASPDTFDKLKDLPNTTTLPLSISYRCAENIVKFAQNIVPTLEGNNDGRKGEIVKNSTLEDIEENDMVLCRNNAPLMQVYANLIRMGKRCYIRGKDIGKNLSKLVNSTKIEDLNLDLNEDGVFARLYDMLFKMRDGIILRNGISSEMAMNNPVITNHLDMINALEVLAEGLSTASELTERIDAIFADNKKEGIALSTIHKAKGLEATNVHIACASLMPSQSAIQEWEIEQEKNLMYVAYTRAKDKLTFLDEKGFDKFKKISVSTLQKIENQVDYVLGRTTIKPITSKGYSGITTPRTRKLSKPIIGSSTVLQPKSSVTPSKPLTSLVMRRNVRRKK